MREHICTDDKKEDFFVVITEKPEKLSKHEEAGIKLADFETAIVATGFGKFNILMILTLIPSSMASIFSTTTMSYIFPIAQCDLDLSLEDKGLLNAITFFGMISSAFVWGYLADTIGRKKLLIIGFFLDSFFVILCGFSHNFEMVLGLKFMTGFIINGPFAILASYVSEFHSAKYRPYILLFNGVFFSIASLTLPIMGWGIFTESINISLFDGFIVLKSWNLFLFVSAVPSLTSAIAYLFFPESPKFLMATGRNERALEAFRIVYACNTGNSPESYPIEMLLDETKLNDNDPKYHEARVTANRTKVQALQQGWQQLAPLFRPPFVSQMLLVFLIQFLIMKGLNTLRLWLPQLFTAMNDYHTFHTENSSPDLCDMLTVLTPNSTANNETCFVNYNNTATYKYNIIVASVQILIYSATTVLIGFTGKKFVLISSGLVCGMCGLSMYFARKDVTIVALASLYTGLSGVASNVMISVVVDIFPTTLRTMTVSLLMMFGRSGSMIGNLVFPVLLESGCLPPFLALGCLTIASALLSFALPKTEMKSLQ